jgi:hypothetical protein
MMLKRVWVDVKKELPPDRWIGTIKVRFPHRVSELECLGFQKNDPITGVVNNFTYQHGTVNGKTGEWNTPLGTVTHWFKVVDE